MKLKPITEAQFQRQVIAFAKLHGWTVAHFRPGMNRRGEWMTAVQGDGVGFPDLILLRGEKIVVAELKTARGKVTREQQIWLQRFAATAAQAYTWRPENGAGGVCESCRWFLRGRQCPIERNPQAR